MGVNETVTHFSGTRTLSHSVGGPKNFTTNFHFHIRYYGSMATTTGYILKCKTWFLNHCVVFVNKFRIYSNKIRYIWVTLWFKLDTLYLGNFMVQIRYVISG